MTTESTGHRAVWKSPTRATVEEAQADYDRVVALLREHAPDLAPLAEKPVPGAAALRHKTPG